MVSSATNRTTQLNPDHWLQAATTRLTREGVGAVRVELLARDLGVSKGSFYWHFRDRADLLEKLLAAWEASELNWLAGDLSQGSAPFRWARFIERTSDPQRMGLAVAVGAWARQDERVAATMSTVDSKKAALLAKILRDIGFDSERAESWSSVILLVCNGWIDRTTRDQEFKVTSPGLGELLSDLILAASARSPGLNR
jgi:AcrR family transcriptional regulator